MSKNKSVCLSKLKIVTILGEGVRPPISLAEITQIQHKVAGIALLLTNFLSFHKSAEITVKITGDDEITEANKEFRGKNKPTNVLSFPALDWNYKKITTKDPLYDGYLGDIIISMETLKKEALDQGKSIVDHYLHLFLHGVLHLIGYDHTQDEDARIMEDLEIRILQLFSIKDPYLINEE